ncbi:MAG: substrate-binding domain-containing protein [Proteobacteria bacterium]|nr:substrate-binding domain-containing protein [Pseudomonadota bacterium]
MRTPVLPLRRALAAALLVPLAALAAVRGQVILVGSSTVFPFAAYVAESFGRRGQWPTPVVESTGTGGGFRLFCSGIGVNSPDINDASRPMTDAERADCASHGIAEVTVLRVGSDGILVASARRAAALDLSREQLYRAIARSVPVGGHLVPNPYHRWREVDPALPDRPIRILGPAPNHGTRDAFVALALEPACERHAEVQALGPAARRAACQTVREDGAWVDVTGDYAVLVGKLADDPDAVAILTYAYLDQNRGRLQAARIDGVAPTLEAIAAARYPLARPLFIYVKTAHVGAVPGLAEFVREFVSDRAAGPDGYLVDKGLAPMPRSALAAEQAKAAALGAAQR